MLPVAETPTIVIGSTTEPDDDTSDEKTNNGDDLDGGENELGFTVDGDGKDVQADDEDEDERNPDSWVVLSFCVPELDQKSGGGDFSTESNGAVVPVVPSDSEAKSGVDVSGAVLGDSTGERKPCSHFTQRLHHTEDKHTSDAVSEQH